MQVSGKLTKKENNISVDLSVPKSSQLKNNFIYRSLVLSLFVLIPLYLISLYASFGSQSISGFAVSENKPALCEGYFGDKYCDDSPADCGGNYEPGNSLDACDECQTIKNGKVGYGKCLGTTQPPTTSPPPSSQKCEDSDAGKNYYVKGSTSGFYADSSYISKKDECLQGDLIYEWYCYDTYNIKVDTQQCPNANGCKDGACILLGDLTNDGCVNIFDLVTVVSTFDTKDLRGDANGDGIVNIFDIIIVQNNFGVGWCHVLENQNINGSFINDTVFENMSFINFTFFNNTFINDTFKNVTFNDTEFINNTFINTTWINDTLNNISWINNIFINVTWINNTFINNTWINNTFINNSWSNNSFIGNVLVIHLTEISPSKFQGKFYFKDKGNYKLSVDMAKGIIEITDITKDDIITPDEVSTLSIGGDNKATWYLEGYPYSIIIRTYTNTNIPRVAIIMQQSVVTNIPEKNTISGDLNKDGCVDVLDLVTVASSFGTKEGDGKYSPMADLNKDKVVDIFDLTAVGNSFGQGTCPSGGVLPPQPPTAPPKQPIPQTGCSCVNNCNNQVKGNCVNTKYADHCWCDQQCSSLGDCCPDKKDVCG